VIHSTSHTFTASTLAESKTLVGISSVSFRSRRLLDVKSQLPGLIGTLQLTPYSHISSTWLQFSVAVLSGLLGSSAPPDQPLAVNLPQVLPARTDRRACSKEPQRGILSFTFVNSQSVHITYRRTDCYATDPSLHHVWRVRHCWFPIWSVNTTTY